MNKEFKDIVIGIKRAIGLLDRKEKKSLFIATLIMFFTGLLTNLPAIILGRLVDSLTKANDIDFAFVLPFILSIALIIIVRESLTILRKYLVENIATQLDKKQTVRVIERLLKAELGDFLYKEHIGSLHGRIFRSMQGLVRTIKLVFLDFAPIFFSAIAAIGIALFQKPLIASVMILVIPSGLYLIFKQVSSQKGIRISLLRGKEQIDGHVVEMLSGIETIRILNTEKYEIEKIEEIAEKQRLIEIKHHIQMALFDSAKYLNEGFFYILVIVLSIYLASINVISRGDILVYSILFISIVSPLREIHRILDQAHEGSIQVNDLYALLHQPIDKSFIKVKPDEVSQNKKQADYVISIKNLNYSFFKTNTATIIEDITLNIKSNEKIGIAGASGSGKTTLINILLKLVHGYKGNIHLFGKDLEFVDREFISKNIAYVPQRPFIFSGTIKDNITYGLDTNVSAKELVSAMKAANIYDEIENSLGGLEGRVLENGSNLSGGQRQRLSLARLMLQSPEVIILDEATSALDNANEAAVQTNIEKRFKNKCIITIAHRLTTLRNCDRILVLDKGKIVQEGRYAELEKEKGLFQHFLKKSKLT